MNDPRNISTHAHAMMVEQIMALIGRSSRDPKSYRRTLESFEASTLRRTLEDLTDAAGEPMVADRQVNAATTTSTNGPTHN